MNTNFGKGCGGGKPPSSKLFFYIRFYDCFKVLNAFFHGVYIEISIYTMDIHGISASPFRGHQAARVEAHWTIPLPPPSRVASAWVLSQKGCIFGCHFQSVLSATCCPYLAPSCQFESQNDSQSHPKSLQNWSPKPSLLQSADVLDNPLFKIRNGPQAALHQLQKPSKIGSNCNLN